jgi:hypothetical protein
MAKGRGGCKYMAYSSRKECETAWELWNLLNKLNDILWERYDEHFEALDNAEREQRANMISDEDMSEEYPF